MRDRFLPRSLWYRDDRERHSVDESFLRSDARSLVILGEAGMGKSTLLSQLCGLDGYVVCSARALINAPDFNARYGMAQTLVVDALDEVPAQHQGDVVDLVVRKLGEIGYPRFIVSCRVADWRSATALQGFRELYASPPIELHLNPLDRDDAIVFLSASLDDERAKEVVGYLESHGLTGLWSNPQTLELVEQVALEGQLPASKGELFEKATKILGREHREEKANTKLATLPQDEVLNVAGAAFAALILTGKEAISRRANVALTDIGLPQISALSASDTIGAVLDSRLFAAIDNDRFTYTHRAIGEFLGARWLASHCDSDRKRRRLFELFNGHALVPASLRGMHAWLAWHSSALAEQVIATDPLGVIQYGDAAKLHSIQAQALLRALSSVAEDNPWFMGWERFRAPGLAKLELLSELTELITRQETPHRLKLLLFESLHGSSLIQKMAPTLESILMDQSQVFATRSEAGELLIEAGISMNWTSTIEELRAEAGENGIRLAIELMGNVGYDQFDDKLLLEVVLSQLERVEHTVGVYFSFERKLSPSRIDAVLDGLSAVARMDLEEHDREQVSAITDLVYGLLARRLAHRPVSAKQLWNWLEPFDSNAGLRDESRKYVAEFLSRDLELKQSIQRLVLLEQPGEENIWQRTWRLTRRSPGLNVQESDVLALLSALEPDDANWRELVLLVHHDGDRGRVVREAAARFVKDDAESAAWLESLSTPQVPAWQIKDEQRQKKRKAKREEEWAKHRANYAARIVEMRSGHYGTVVQPAKAYLKMFADIGDDAVDGPGRIEEWLGTELCVASLEGFEAFLQTTPVRPTASQLAQSYAEGRGWDAATIIVAALAERIRTERGFEDLPSERLMAGLFEVRHTRIDEHAGIDDLEQRLADVLRERGCWEETQRLYFEPQFANNQEHISGLHELLNDARDTDLSLRLSIEWLTRYSNMPNTMEVQLLDHLVSSSEGRSALRSLAVSRRKEAGLEEERRRNWTAISLIVDFEQTSTELDAQGYVEKDLLYNIRSRVSDRYSNTPPIDLNVQQLMWMVQRFRRQFPVVERPSGVTRGDENPWNLSEFISALISRLGDKISADAIEAMASLRDEEADGYTNMLRAVAAEQRRKKVELDWVSPDLDSVVSVVHDNAPTTPAQLQVILLEELNAVQRKLRGSDVDWYRDFYQGGRPRVEDDCRDTILKMLRPLPFEIQALPEGHLADDKRCDIICLLGDVMVPIEIKGQWHDKLWTAADQQLDRLYVNDWRAQCGIYLVLWFGTRSQKPPKDPPPGISSPVNAEELRRQLVECSATTREGRVEVVVLDLERPRQ